MAEIHLDLLNLNSILLILLMILIGGYLYYEIYQLKSIINDLQYTINKQNEYYRNEQPEQHEQPEQPEQHEQSLQDDSVTYHPDIDVGGNISEEGTGNLYPESTITPDPIVGDRELIREQMEYSHGINDIHSDDGKDIPSQQNNSANIDDILLGKNIITDNTLSDVLNVDNDLQKIDEFMNTIKASEETKNEPNEVDYSSMTVSQLKKILSDEGISVSGNKTKLIQRIKENKL